MSLRRVVLTVAGCAAGLFAQTTATMVTRTLSLPPIGVAGSETAQINVVNLASASSSGPAASCTGSISFLNASGTALGSATSFAVAGGQISSASLKAPSGNRTMIRGVVTINQSMGASAAPCDLQVSMETFDASTGVTHAYMVGSEMVSGPVGRPTHDR